MIDKWRVRQEGKARQERIGELGAEGHHPQDAKRIQRLEEELVEYKKKVGEQTLIIDLLKNSGSQRFIYQRAN